MKLPFFKKPPDLLSATQENSLQRFRERIMAALLYCAVTLGGIVYIISVISAFQKGQWWTVILTTIVYLWLLNVTLRNRVYSLTIKITSLSILFYLFGVVKLVQNGLSVDGVAFLLMFVIMTSIFMGLRYGLGALILSIATFAIVGLLMISSKITPSIIVNYRDASDWLSSGAVLLWLGTMTTLSLTNIVQGLENSTSKAITLATTVEHDRQQLRQCSEELQHRLVQIRSEAEIIHTVSTAFNQKISVQQMVDLIGERLNLYYVGILLLEGSGDTAVLHACTNKIIPEGYRLTLSETSTIGWAISKRSPRMADITNPDGQLGFTQLPQARTELSLPLISGDNILGALTIQSTRPNAFNEDDIAVMQNIADSLALALDNAHLFTQFQAGLDEIRSLKQQYLVQAWSTAERTHGKLSYTFENDLPLPTDVQLSTLKTPIILRDQAIGQISLETDKVSWTPEEQGFIDSVTTEAARALENARLLEETQRRAAHERFVADITRAVRASTDIETILSTAIRELSHSFRASEGVIQLNTPTENIIQGEENGNSGN